MQIQLKGTVLHDGVEYTSGQYLTCSDQDALALIRARVAVKIEKVTVVPSPVVTMEKVPAPSIIHQPPVKPKPAVVPEKPKPAVVAVKPQSKISKPKNR